MAGPAEHEAASTGGGRSTWRRWVVLPAALLGVALAFFVRGILLESEHRLGAAQFRGDAKALIGSIEREFAIGVETIQALRAFFMGSEEVNAAEFEDFTGLVLQAHDEIEAFEWAERRDGTLHHEYSATHDPADAPPPVLAPGEEVDAAIARAEREERPVALPPRDGRILVVAPAQSKNQVGVVAAWIVVDRAKDAAGRRFGVPYIKVDLFDPDAPPVVLAKGQEGCRARFPVEIAGLELEFEALPEAGYTSGRETPAPDAVLLSLLAATALAVGYLWNVTSRTARIERVVEERTATIREVTRLQRAILESAPYAILSFDAAGLILTLNPAAESLLGCRAQDAVGKSRLADFLDPGELEERVAPPEAGGVSGPLLSLATRAGDDAWTLWRRDGNSVPVRLSVSALRRESGEVAGFLAIAHDISARLATEAELKEAKARAEETSHLKSRFLANMSHELRTPLTAILGYSEMLEEDARAAGDEGAAGDCARIGKAGRHLLRLIDEILDLSKIESGRIELQIERVELRALVDEVASMVRPLAAEKKNRVEVSAQAGAHVRADPMRLKQVLFNLAANAARFTEGGTITLDAAREGDAVAFRVRDTGIGMSEEELRRVFEPFVQADGSTTRRYGGTGLGLAIAKQFTEMMVGTLTATSEPGKGSEFLVRLPA